MEYGRQSMPRKSKIKFNTKRHKKRGGGGMHYQKRKCQKLKKLL